MPGSKSSYNKNKLNKGQDPTRSLDPYSKSPVKLNTKQKKKLSKLLSQ